MPPSSQRTLYISLSVITFILLIVVSTAPRPNLNSISISSPFGVNHGRTPHRLLHQRPQHPHRQHGQVSHQEPQPERQPTWLLATISAYFSQRRRNIIRATWQTLYASPAFSTRFVIAKPSPLWQPLIEHENATYGDLIVLETLEESAEVANTVKSVEFLKRLVAGGAEAPWEFVSKIDDDSFLSAGRFHREFLLPRIDQRHADDNNGTLIGRRLERSGRNFSTPGGQFYTLSWDLVRLVAETHEKNPISDVAEDVLIGRLLYEAEARFEFVELDDSRAFDISDDLHRLSKEREDLGPMDSAALNPHKMKDDETYLRVAGLFGTDGFVGESYERRIHDG